MPCASFRGAWFPFLSLPSGQPSVFFVLLRSWHGLQGLITRFFGFAFDFAASPLPVGLILLQDGSRLLERLIWRSIAFSTDSIAICTLYLTILAVRRPGVARSIPRRVLD